MPYIVMILLSAAALLRTARAPATESRFAFVPILAIVSKPPSRGFLLLLKTSMFN